MIVFYMILLNGTIILVSIICYKLLTLQYLVIATRSWPRSSLDATFYFSFLFLFLLLNLRTKRNSSTFFISSPKFFG